MLVALSNLVSKQAVPTIKMMWQARWILNYAKSNEMAVVTFWASIMVLAMHSNATYLSTPQVKSRARGHFFFQRMTYSSGTTEPSSTLRQS